MKTAPAPWVRLVALPPPTIKNNTADADRLVAELAKALPAKTVDIGFDLDLLRQLPALVRQSGYRLRCTLFRKRDRWILTGISGADDARTVAGLAVDLGTTRVVLRLIDLATGTALAEHAFDNPQAAVGPDVLARIHHAETPAGLRHLHALIINGLNGAIDSICRTAGLRPKDISAVTVAGNTCMTHLFLGLEPRWIIREPYIPVINRPGVLRASDLGLRVGPFGRVLVFPNIGSYFGGDLIAGILFSGLHQREDTAILVDVGTNAEVVLGNRDWLIGCAGAAGPALESGVTRMGMLAGPGVVDRVSIDPATGAFDIHTIGDETPRGICGSGVIDLAAQLFLHGMIDIRGKLVPARCGDRLKIIGDIRHFVVVPAAQSASGGDLTISQADLDSLIRSKAAMYTILETLTMTVGTNLGDLNAFYVAGTFGCFINPRSAIAIGMLPDLPPERYVPIGNSSLEGAALVLTSASAIDEVDRIRDRITYLELNVNQDFMNRFSAAKFLPHTDVGRFPSVQPG
ncbi:MAG: ASKHA domain-containing protein [Desulfobacterales bacterium]|nr:ASKHA domain-containing protein [Desulfobacterales bacterium]